MTLPFSEKLLFLTMEKGVGMGLTGGFLGVQLRIKSKAGKKFSLKGSYPIPPSPIVHPAGPPKRRARLKRGVGRSPINWKNGRFRKSDESL
jgi:hypothetical protein